MSREPDRETHVPVLLDEVVNNLVHAEQGTYVDATFGRGGHTQALLRRLGPGGRVFAVDRDPEAVAYGRVLATDEPRLHIHHGRFAELERFVAEWGLDCVDGVLLDLGVSSPQLDDASRGFSFRETGPLDMRMDPSQSVTAASWLNTCDPEELTVVLKRYGEERFARRIARAIISGRPVTTTAELAALVEAAVPARFQTSKKHPATQTFQAIRIHVNDELGELARGLTAAFEVLCTRGRLAVISFHSLEDREVKRRFRSWTQPAPVPRRVPVKAADQSVRAVEVAGPIRASRSETHDNPRARSATLRVIEKCAND